MIIWTGIFCRSSLMVVCVGVLTFTLLSLNACETSSGPNTPAAARSNEIDKEVSLKSDRQAVEDLRKDIPVEVKKSNDRLAETLTRWKAVKMPPEELRERFNDEIRKMRSDLDKRQHHKRDDFQRELTEKRKDFQDKQKDARDEYFASKPKSDKRSSFITRQSEERDRLQTDQRDARDDFEDAMKDERKEFEADIASRWTEFRQEYPEYTRLYKEMKAEEEKQKDLEKDNPKPYAGWPYKVPGDGSSAAPSSASGTSPGSGSASGSNSASGSAGTTTKADPTSVDVNKGQDGWPSSDSSEFDKMGN